MVVGLEVKNSAFISHFWNFDKALGDGERLVQDFAPVFDGLELEHLIELDGSRLVGLVEGR